MKIHTTVDSSALNACAVDTYLLEKGRVSHHGPGEQNFHAFYFLTSAAANAANANAAHGSPAGGDAAAPADTIDWSALAVLCDRSAAAGASAFRYLTAAADTGRHEPSAASADRADASSLVGAAAPARAQAEFAQVCASLRELGASAADVHAAWAALGAVLAIGEIDITDAPSDAPPPPPADASNGDAPPPPPPPSGGGGANEGTDDEGKASIPDSCEAMLGAAASLLGVEAVSLRHRLLSRSVHTGRGSNYVVRYSPSAARSCRDGLSHEIYQRLFAWVVALVNKSLSRGAAPVEEAKASGGEAPTASAGATPEGAREQARARLPPCRILPPLPPARSPLAGTAPRR